MVILSHCHLGNRSAFNWPIKQTSLDLSKKKIKLDQVRKEGGSFRLPEDLRISSYEKAVFPSERMPTSAPGYKSNKCCEPYLCWSCLLQWKAHIKSAGFISLVPGHVNLLPSTCGKSSKVLGLLHCTKKSVQIWKPRFVSEGVLCAVFLLQGLYKSH